MPVFAKLELAAIEDGEIANHSFRSSKALNCIQTPDLAEDAIVNDNRDIR